MSSYGSTHSGYLHPSQYPPSNPTQNQQPQPPYPTTPGAIPIPRSQPQAFYPPAPQHQPTYSTSPASPYNQPFYSSSPQHQQPPPPQFYPSPLHQQQQQQQQHYSTSPQHTYQPHHRRSSSSSSRDTHPHFPTSTAPIPIPHQAPVYARHESHSSSHYGSHHSQHMHDPHAYADGEDKYDGEQVYGVLDDETLRAYEKRYAKYRELEKRPTLGGSLLSAMRILGGKRQ